MRQSLGTFRRSSVVEQPAVNRLVVGSTPTVGAIHPKLFSFFRPSLTQIPLSGPKNLQLWSRPGLRWFLTLTLLAILHLNCAADDASVLTFELGEVAKPSGTTWTARETELGRLHIGVRKTDKTEVFMVAISRSGSTLADHNADLVAQGFAESYARSLAQTLDGEAVDIRGFPVANGSQFSFRLKGGNRVFGRLIQGRQQTLVFTGIGATQKEVESWWATFQPAQGAFMKPLSQVENAIAIVGRLSWMLGLINLAVALAVAIIAKILEKGGVRFALAALCICAGFEFAVLLGYTLHLFGLSWAGGRVSLSLVSGMVFTCGVPICLVALWLTKLRKA